MSIDGKILLIMDYQDEIVGMAKSDDVVARTGKVLDAARAAGMPVAFVVVGFRPGYPEASATNKSFAAIKAAGRLVDPQVIAALAPREGEAVVTKRRVSALANTDLPVIIKTAGANHLVMAGISTSGVILSTTRAAADLDYEITILEDCCLDSDPEVHALLMGKILPKQANVISSETFIASL